MLARDRLELQVQHRSQLSEVTVAQLRMQIPDLLVHGLVELSLAPHDMWNASTLVLQVTAVEARQVREREYLRAVGTATVPEQDHPNRLQQDALTAAGHSRQRSYR